MVVLAKSGRGWPYLATPKPKPAARHGRPLLDLAVQPRIWPRGLMGGLARSGYRWHDKAIPQPNLVRGQSGPACGG